MKERKFYLFFRLLSKCILSILILIFGCEDEPIAENFIPSCSIVYPLNGDSIPVGSRINILINATDSLDHILKVEIYIDEILKETLITSGELGFNWLWNTTDERMGSHSIKAIAYDTKLKSDTSLIDITIVTNKISDIEDNIYKIVKIGNQTWLADNLRTTKFNDGTPILLLTNNDSWKITTLPAYCWFENNESYKKTYGALYNWYTVETKKLCPSGWHVSTYNEWKVLYDYLGEKAGIKLKESGNAWEYCIETDYNGDNSAGFSALPSGRRASHNGEFYENNLEEAYYWSATEYDNLLAFYTGLFSCNPKIYFNDAGYPKRAGYSVRCVKD